MLVLRVPATTVSDSSKKTEAIEGTYKEVSSIVENRIFFFVLVTCVKLLGSAKVLSTGIDK